MRSGAYKLLMAAQSHLGRIAEYSLHHRCFTCLSDLFVYLLNCCRRFIKPTDSRRTIGRLLKHRDWRYFLVPLKTMAENQMALAARESRRVAC